jgi:carboxyl-terminal processing protease
VETRIAANPEFQYVVEDTTRLKERIDRNTISLNEKERQKELDETRSRSETRKTDRKTRVEDLAKTAKPGFDQYRLTLDNVDKPELMKESAFTKEQATGMRVAESEDDEDGVGDLKIFPYGMDPAKLETLHVLRDLIQLSGRPAQTANTSDARKANGS